MSREIRLELADWRTRTGGVYDLPRTRQEALLVDGHLPTMGPFLPDFVIILGLGEPAESGDVRWNDLRVHVGGLTWPNPAAADAAVRRMSDSRLGAEDWASLDDVLHGNYRRGPAPAWLLNLIRTRTPWSNLLDSNSKGQQ